MCGIFSLIGAADKELGERIAVCLHHRGPPAVWINPPQATQSAPADAPKLTGVDTADLH